MKLKAGCAVGSFLSFLLMFRSAVAVADSTTPPASGSEAESAADSSTKLEDVVVTATRRSESVEKVPLSIAALSRADLEEGGIKNVADIAAATPGLQFQTPNGAATLIDTISIRGMNTQTGASVVGIYLDDTPLQGRQTFAGNIGSPFPVLFDLNRVEVERGPQGTLFGAGSEAGTVRFITNQPSLTEYSGFSHGEFASTEYGGLSYEAGAAVGGPIVNDKLGFRVSVWDRRDGGYVDRIAPTDGTGVGPVVDSNANVDDKQAIRMALAVQATDDVLVTPSVSYQRSHLGDSGRFYEQFSDLSSGTFKNGRLLPDRSTDQLVVPSVKGEVSLPFADLTAVASYLYRDVNESFDQGTFLAANGLVNYGSPLGPAFATSGADVSPFFTGQVVRGYTEEVRLASNRRDAFVTWVAGIYNDHRTQIDTDSWYSTLLDPTGAPILHIFQQVVDKQIAAFAQGDFHVTDKWTATLGARVARVSTDLHLTNGTGVLDSAPPVVDTSLTQTPFTPKITLSYQADANNLFYTSIGKGYRVGGPNDPLPSFCDTVAPNSFKSDYVWSYEAGAKNKLFDGRLQIDSSAFHIEWFNIQQVVQLQCDDEYTANIGKAKINGFDIALQALVTDRLGVKVSVGYANAYNTVSVYNNAGAPLVLAGDKVGFLPQVNSPWDVNTSANYEFPVAHGEKIHLRAEYQYHSHNPGPFAANIPTSPSYFPRDAADPATHLVNARAGVTAGKLDLSFFINNVFDSHPLLSKYEDTPTSNLFTYSTFRPRTIGLSANLGF